MLMCEVLGCEVSERMHDFSISESRRSKRVMLKRRASLRINLDYKPKRFRCHVLDFSLEGFRVRGRFDLKCGQVVELVLGKDLPTTNLCRVAWVGQAGSKHKGEVGLSVLPFRTQK